VKDIASDGAGAKIGLRAGDVILEIDGTAVSGMDEFKMAVSTAKKNKVIRLMIQRGSAKIFLAGTLG